MAPHEPTVKEPATVDAGSVELGNNVSAVFDMELPATATFDHPTVSALAAFIASRLAPGQTPSDHGLLATDKLDGHHEVVLHSVRPTTEDVLQQLKVTLWLTWFLMPNRQKIGNEIKSNQMKSCDHVIDAKADQSVLPRSICDVHSLKT